MQKTVRLTGIQVMGVSVNKHSGGSESIGQIITKIFAFASASSGNCGS